MDIENDIEKFKSLGYKVINRELEELEEEIKTKRYFFKVVNLLNELDILIQDSFFEKHGIKVLRLEKGYDMDIGHVFSQIEILDDKNQSIHIYNYRGDYIIGYEMIDMLLSPSSFVLVGELYNSDIKKKKLDILLNENMKNIFKGYLLNKDLLKIYNYMEMLDKNPPKNNQEKSSRKKI